MLRSSSFETQKVGEIGRKEANESRGFTIWWMGIAHDNFQREEKNINTRKDSKYEEDP